MGFRGMASFNLALLTKQGWRITTSSDQLLSKILKARYFPSSSFHCSELGERPSWTCMSIILTEKHLEEGIRQRVGNGANTSIWGDAWLMSEGTEKIITTRPMHSSYPNIVSGLIHWEQGSWAIDRINQFLWPCDIDCVIQVPIGTSDSVDCSYCFFSKMGKFTLWSAYYHILSQESNLQAFSSGSSFILSSGEWKWLWGFQLPPQNPNVHVPSMQ